MRALCFSPWILNLLRHRRTFQFQSMSLSWKSRQVARKSFSHLVLIRSRLARRSVSQSTILRRYLGTSAGQLHCVGFSRRLGILAANRSALTVDSNLRGQRNAVAMLTSCIEIVMRYLNLVSSGELPAEPQLLRDISGLCHRLTPMELSGFDGRYLQVCPTPPVSSFAY